MPGVFKKVFQYFTNTQPVNKQYRINISSYTGSYDGKHHVLGFEGIHDSEEYPSDEPAGFTVATSSVNGGASIQSHYAHISQSTSRDIYSSVRSNFYNKTNELNVKKTALVSDVGTLFTYNGAITRDYINYTVEVDPSNYAYKLEKNVFYSDYYAYFAERSLRNTKNFYYPKSRVNTQISKSLFNIPGIPYYDQVEESYPDATKWFGSKVKVVSVPQRVFGTKIEPNTFKLESEEGIVISDDGLGNLKDDSRENHILSSSKNTILDLDFSNIFLLQSRRKLSKESQSLSINSGSKTPNRLQIDRSYFGGNEFEINRFYRRLDDATSKGYIDLPGYDESTNNTTFELTPGITTTKLNSLSNFSQSQDYSVYCRFRLPPTQSDFTAPYNWLFGKGNTPNIVSAQYPHTQSNHPRTPFQARVWNGSGGVGNMSIRNSFQVLTQHAGVGDGLSVGLFSNGIDTAGVGETFVVDSDIAGPQGDFSIGASFIDAHVQGRLEIIKSDLNTQSFLTSSTKVNDNLWHDLVMVSSGSKLEMYLDANLVATSSASDPHSPNPISGQIHYTPVDGYGNSLAHNLWVGVGVDKEYTTQEQQSSTGTRNAISRKTFRSNSPTSCSLATFKLWNKGLNSNEVDYLTEHSSGSQNGYVGNIFYEKGFAIITDTSRSYDIVPKEATMSLANNHYITEHEYLCNIDKEEFNVSTNPSLLANQLTREFKTVVSSSAFTPYITTVGLYNEHNELLVIGKLGQPLKKTKKYDINIVVRFDT